MQLKLFNQGGAMNMRKYVEAEMEVIRFDAEDVITESPVEEEDA